MIMTNPDGKPGDIETSLAAVEYRGLSRGRGLCRPAPVPLQLLKTGIHDGCYR